MGTQAVLLSLDATKNQESKFNRCYLLAESGKEIQVTKEMIGLVCQQILARCKK